MMNTIPTDKFPHSLPAILSAAGYKNSLGSKPENWLQDATFGHLFGEGSACAVASDDPVLQRRHFGSPLDFLHGIYVPPRDYAVTVTFAPHWETYHAVPRGLDAYTATPVVVAPSADWCWVALDQYPAHYCRPDYRRDFVFAPPLAAPFWIVGQCEPHVAWGSYKLVWRGLTFVHNDYYEEPQD